MYIVRVENGDRVSATRPSKKPGTRRRGERWFGVAAAAALLVAAGVAGGMATPAAAAAVPASASTPTPEVVTSTPDDTGLTAPETPVGDQISIAPFYCNAAHTTQHYKVPDGVSSLYVEAVGGQGQTPDPSQTGLGGLAGQVAGGLNVTPGQILTVQVGCAGDAAGGASDYAAGGERGTGWSNLNDFLTIYSFGYDGGGGGGASAVSDASGTEIVVAGGGGGAAGDAPNCLESSTLKNGGGGFFYYCGPGFAQVNGGDGGNGAGDDTEGGAGANNTAGPTPDGSSCGGPNAGGKGGDFDKVGGGGAGGGGGGGYGGGCGGAAGEAAVINPGHEEIVPGSAGAGGGGGRSYAAPTVNDPAITVSDDSGDGYVLFITSADGVRTSHYGFTGHPEAFCVPDGVDEIFVDALGGGGAGGGSDFPDHTGTGGSGGGVRAVVPVAERTQLEIRVGGYGNASGGWGDGHGGKRGTSGSEGDGAGGGGSTAVKQSSTPCGETELHDLEYLVVGGGGGGGGGHASDAHGGDGGDAGNPGGDGSVGGDPNGGAAGCGGEAPGAGCESGVDGGHGTEATDGGGGGGGGAGYNGGGKGHGAQDGELGGGGGGGGGASYVTPKTPDAVDYYLGLSGDRSNHDGLNEGKVDLIVPVPTSRSAVSIVSGNEQSAQTGQAFAEPLVVKYVDAVHGPVAGEPLALTIEPIDGRLPATFEGASGDGSTIQVVTDAAAQAQVQLTAPGAPVGQFVVTASVASNPDSLIKSAEFTEFAVAWPTTLAVTSDAVEVDGNGVAAVGEPVTYTATVTPAGASMDAASALAAEAIITGSVQFSIDGVDLGDPVAVDENGVATSDPAVTGGAGQHHVKASYTDAPGGHEASIFTSYSLTALPPSTSVTSLTSSAPDGIYGNESVTFPVAVTAIGDAPFEASGTVQLYNGTHPLGDPIPLTDSTGTSPSFPASVFELGVNEITAVYSGTDQVLSSTSGEYSLIVIDFGDRPPAGTDPSQGGSGGSPGSAGGPGHGPRGGGLAATGATLAPVLAGILFVSAGLLLTLRRTRRTRP
jgi:hypothetical protein